MTVFGFYAFTPRFGMTYELSLAKQVDYSGVDAFKAATAGGCPPGSGSGNLPAVGVGAGAASLPFSDLQCDGGTRTA